MPLYEFHCDACSSDFEVYLHSVSQRIKPECPECKSNRIHKKFSSFGVNSKSAGGASSSPSSGGCATCRATSCSTCKQ